VQKSGNLSQNFIPLRRVSPLPDQCQPGDVGALIVAESSVIEKWKACRSATNQLSPRLARLTFTDTMPVKGSRWLNSQLMPELSEVAQIDSDDCHNHAGQS
jgi:hypothetical protein